MRSRTLRSFASVGGDPANPAEHGEHGGVDGRAGDCAKIVDMRVDIRNGCDFKVDHFWANFCSQDNVAMPFVAARLGVKKIVHMPCRLIIFDDKPEVRTHVVDDCFFQRQTPPASFLSCDKVGRKIVVDSAYT